MDLEEVLDVLSRKEDIRIDREGGEVTVYVRENGVFDCALRIYLGTASKPGSAEFLDINDEDWDELQYALEDRYGGFPELGDLARYLDDTGYGITW